MLMKRLRILWWDHKFWFIFTAFMFGLLILTVMGISKLDSFFAAQIVYTMPLEVMKIICYSVLGAFFWIMMYRSGFSFSGKAGSQIDAKEIQIGFQDVVGLTEAKREAME